MPTVTVCQDQTKLPDNWALIETILNPLAFQCSNDSKGSAPGAWHIYKEEEGRRNVPSCKTVMNIQEDFIAVTKKATQRIKELVKDPRLQDLSIYSDSYSYKSNLDLLDDLAIALTKGELKSEDLDSLPERYFGHSNEVLPIFKALIGTDEDYYFPLFGYGYQDKIEKN